MAINVTVGQGKTVTEVKVSGRTKVASVRVGRPIRNVTQKSGSIDVLDGIDVSNKQDGSVLVYNSGTENFEATKNLDKQFINGGNF
jgi:hypothetical protein